MRALVLAAAIAAAASFSALPATAHHDGAPILASGAFAHAAWIAVAVDTNGAPVEFMANVVGAGGPVHAAAYAYDESGANLAYVTYNGFAAMDGAYVSAPAAAFEHDAMMRGDFSFAGAGVGLTANGPGSPVEFDVVQVILLASGDLESWSWRIASESPAEILETRSGTGAFLYTSLDFEGAQAQAYLGGFGGRASPLLVKSVEIAHTLVGIYSSVVSANALAVVGDEWARPCADLALFALPHCMFPHAAGEDAVGAGSYTFLASGAGAGISGLAEFYLAGADVELPLAT